MSQTLKLCSRFKDVEGGHIQIIYTVVDYIINPNLLHVCSTQVHVVQHLMMPFEYAVVAQNTKQDGTETQSRSCCYSLRTSMGTYRTFLPNIFRMICYISNGDFIQKIGKHNFTRFYHFLAQCTIDLSIRSATQIQTNSTYKNVTTHLRTNNNIVYYMRQRQNCHK